MSIVLLIILLIVAAFAIVIICLYNRRKHNGGWCRKKVVIGPDTKKEAEVNLPPVSLKRLRLKPLMSFNYDKGKTSMEMLANEYETVNYKVRLDDRGSSIYSNAHSNHTN